MENTIPSSSNNPENSTTQYVGLSGENISQEKTVKVQASYLIRKQNAVVAKGAKKQFRCDVCGKEYNQKGKLTIHKGTHSSEGSFKCEYCEKTYYSREGITNHFKTHTGEKKHECDICLKSFERRTHLKEHMIVHTGEKPHKCNNHCGKTFINKSELRYHVRFYKKENDHVCQVCSKQFYKNGNLERHIVTHTGEKPFKCNGCGKKFSRKDTLKKHQKDNCCKNTLMLVSDKKFTSTEHIHAQVQMQTAGNVIATGATPFYQYQPEETKNLEESVGSGQDQAVSSTRIPMPPMPTQSSEKILSRAQLIKVKKFRETETRDKVSLPVLSTLPMEQGSVYPTMLENTLEESNSEQPLYLSLPKTSQNSMPQTSQNSTFHRPWETSTSHATEDLNQGASASGSPARYMPYQQIETSQTDHRVQNSASFLC